MAEGIESKYPGIGSKTVGSEGTSDEWNGLIKEFNSINAPDEAPYAIELGLGTVSDLPTQSFEPNILIGKNTSDADDPEAINWANGGAIAIGNDAHVSGWRCMALGHKSLAMGVSSTALGYGTIAVGGHAIALGRGAHSYNAGGTMIGSVGNQDLYLANNHGVSWDDLTGVAFGDAVDAQYKLTTIHGRDGKDWKETPTYTDQIGGDIAIASGRATGTALGGRVLLQSSPNSGATGNNLNALKDALIVDSEVMTNGNSNVIIGFANNPGSVHNPYRLSVDASGFVKATLI